MPFRLFCVNMFVVYVVRFNFYCRHVLQSPAHRKYATEIVYRYYTLKSVKRKIHDRRDLIVDSCK